MEKTQAERPRVATVEKTSRPPELRNTEQETAAFELVTGQKAATVPNSGSVAPAPEVLAFWGAEMITRLFGFAESRMPAETRSKCPSARVLKLTTSETVP